MGKLEAKDMKITRQAYADCTAPTPATESGLGEHRSCG